jgi:diguanylate cyclase (GGDEF)-like protein
MTWPRPPTALTKRPGMHRLLQSVERLARLAQRDAGVPTIQRALGEELVVLLHLDQVHVIMLAAGQPLYGMVARPHEGYEEYVLDAGRREHALEWVAESGQPMTIPDVSVGGGLPAEITEPHGLRSAAVLPVRAGDVVRAIVVLGSSSTRTWSAETLRTAGALGELAGAAIALRDARLAAATDPLTGSLNHGAMHERLAEEIARSRRQSTPLSIAMLDLDNFKAVNDTYGHPTGDQLLRDVAEALRAEFRSFDQVARYGGDEFVVILPNVRGPWADIAAIRALRALRELGIDLPDGTRKPITASCGIAEWDEPDGPVELVEHADEALRRTKAEGKDGVRRWARGSVEQPENGPASRSETGA